MIEKERMLRLSSNEIKEQIIVILKNRPAYSIKKSNLATQILRDLGIDIRRETRKIFEYRVLKEVEILKENGIVKEYKSKNVRLKLNNIQEPKFDREPKIDSQYPQPEKTIVCQEVVEEEDDDKDDDPKMRIPELQEEVIVDGKEDSDEIFDNSREEHSDDMIDPEIDRKLRIFLSENDAETKLSNSKNINMGPYSNLLQEINDYYDKNDNVQSQLVSNKIALRAKTSTGQIIIFIDLDEEKSEITIKSLVPYLESANLEILRLFSTCDIMGSLGVEESQDQLFFSVKDSILISKTDCSVILERIDKIVLESIKIDEIIDKYL